MDHTPIDLLLRMLLTPWRRPFLLWCQGMNDEICGVLSESSGNRRWALDCYRRFLQVGDGLTPTRRNGRQPFSTRWHQH
jgi:hypothetical protein